MRIFPLALASIVGFVALTAYAGEHEKRLMDDLLTQINNPALSTEVRILTRLDRLYIPDQPIPAYNSGTNALVLMGQPWWKSVLYTTRPQTDEPDPAPALAACPGESEPFAFAFFPARDAVINRIQVSPPANAEGRTLPESAIQIYRERHIFVAPEMDVRKFRPFALEPAEADMPLLSNVTTRFWIDVTIPAQTPAGLYTGQVDIATDAGPFAFPYTLQVHPFTLLKPKSTKMAWGFWFPPPRDKKLLHGSLQLMAACGITTFAFENWDAVVKPDGTVELHTQELDDVLDAAIEEGLTGPFLIGVGLGEFPGSGAEYTPTWQTNYMAAIRLFSAHMAQKNIPFTAMIFDEPRESNIRPCNRNREQMLTYLDLVDQAAPELRTMINPMTDETSKEYPEGFYTIFAEKFDIVMPHFWARSSNIIARARQSGGAELWSYNDGPNRLGWGLHSWANRLHGRMQYAWLLNSPNDHPYAPVQMGSFEYAGHHPGMHAWATDLEGTLRPTPRLLGVREGIDDYLYAYTLEQVLAKAPDSSLKTEAQSWLEKVRTEVPPYAHAEDFVDETLAGDSDTEFDFTASLDAIRIQAADYITRLSGP